MNMTDAALAQLRGRWLSEEPMARHVSWRAGGAARRAYVPADLDDLVALLPALRADEPVMLVGLGSNLLVRDGGFAGTVVFTHNVLGTLCVLDDGAIEAGAGVASPKVARFAANQGLAGAEFLAGIPGTIGGALAMNAGCYGSETWRVVREVQVLGRDGRLERRRAQDYQVGYRRVALRAGLSQREEWFVAGTFTFSPGSRDAARREIKELLARRIATQPLNLPNAGSVFRNPPQNYAARLIEDCGLKGFRRGGAAISEKHANFIVNLGAASAADIEFLIQEAEARVSNRFGIALEREVRIVGDAR
jgi:UDP-N-acetylmuramate dehydrogenase